MKLETIPVTVAMCRCMVMSHKLQWRDRSGFHIARKGRTVDVEVSTWESRQNVLKFLEDLGNITLNVKPERPSRFEDGASMGMPGVTSPRQVPLPRRTSTKAGPMVVRERTRHPKPHLPAAVASGFLIDVCVCGGTQFEPSTENDLPIHLCVKCGVKHQVLNMTPSQLDDWYRLQYQQYRVDTGRLMERDLIVAQSRLRQYGTLFTGRTLDIGTSNGAFVKAAREMGRDAWGQDLGENPEADHDRVYVGPLASLNFPTDYFDTVTMHDVLEHVLDPFAFLSETLRLTAQEGTLIIDFPDFGAPEGLHHWKAIEHIWLFTQEQLVQLVQTIGFTVLKIERPLSGRYMLYLKKPVEVRTTILVAPGIGDSFWALGKLQSFCEKNDLGLPDVWVSDMGDNKRSLECVQKMPFVNAAGYREGSHQDPVWRRAYMEDKEAVFRNHCGCDYFVAANGGLRAGKSMDQILPEYPMNWSPPMFRTKEEDAFTAQCQAKWGRYVVAYFLNVGMYAHWLTAFPARKINEALNRIQQELDVTIVFSGASWDAQGLPTHMVRAAKNPRFVDFTGQTNFDQLLGLYRGSIGAIGYPSGSTIMSTVLKVPTLMLWEKYFTPKFWKNCCSPESLNNWYGISDCATATPESVVADFFKLVQH